MSVSDYSTTADNNTSISGINVAEGCLPSNVNNAIRQLMADIAQEHADVTAKIGSALKQITDVSGALDKHKVPKGTIALWSGATSNIPTGWALCNGQGGTKDLRNRFIVGAGGSYNVGATGGNASVTPSGSISVSVGSHVLSLNEMPSHNHRVSQQGAHGGSWYNGGGWLTTINSHDWGKHNVYSSNAGSSLGHNHSAWGTYTGSSFDNRPPFYALCFIQKVV